MSVKLLSYTNDYKKVLMTAVSQCYQSKPSMSAVEHCINAGHYSVLEHCIATFEVTCSLQVLLQLTRHRHLSFTVQSSRGSELDCTVDTGDKITNLLIAETMKGYIHRLEAGVSLEDCAYLLPKAITYNLVVTGNFRAWLEYLPKRLCKRTQEEHRKLAKAIHEELKAYIPEVFDRPLVNCENCKENQCNFKGDTSND